MFARVLGVVLLATATATSGVVQQVDRDGYHHRGQDNAQHYTNEWVVRLDGGQEVAQLMAADLGYVYLGAVKGFANTYRMLKEDHPRADKRGFPHLTRRFTSDSRVVWAEQQFSKQRTKRGIIPERDDYRPLTRVKRDDMKVPSKHDKYFFNDDLWDQEWYLHDTRTQLDLPKLDLHVLPLYALGVTGKGVRVTVLDDGLEHTHEDLRENYDAEISYDANDNDADPTPRYDTIKTNAHGTRCAGEIAMTANNRKCGVGVAFNARIGGIRLLDGNVNDAVEGTALGHAYDKVDIYSASWGPTDDGRTVEGPGRLALEAMSRGVKEGRGGKGAIFVWASGNGGSRGDNCNCDGYINSVYTLAVGSASQQGQFPWYGERCAAIFATTYSSGAYYDQMIATTDLRNTCTIKHTGTSAAAPLAAGIIALALEVNPGLTWRDVQHLVMWTSEFSPLSHNDGWQKNAAGMWINVRFGFGLMNAFRLVTTAANWTNVPEKTICSVLADSSRKNSSLVHGVPLVIEFPSDACRASEGELRYLEHVEVLTNIEYPVRGHLDLYLTSPQGTRVQLLAPRENDKSNAGFVDWKFMSVLTWGEDPEGVWSLEIIDQFGDAKSSGKVGYSEVILHGTKNMPEYRANGPRQYDEDYNRTHRKTVVHEDDVVGNLLHDSKPIHRTMKENVPEINYLDLDLQDIEKKETQRRWIERLFGIK